jgi:RHS repeat-associated protein
VAELDGNGDLVSLFVYGERVNVPEYMIRGGVAYRIISDHLGSPRLVVRASSGEVVQRMDYDEFGRVTLDTNPGWQPFGFAGGLWDAQVGLVRFGARDYDPQLGRWTSRDPSLFHPQDSNLYQYVFSDPINHIDPTGLKSFWDKIKDLSTNLIPGFEITFVPTTSTDNSHDGTPAGNAAMARKMIDPCVPGRPETRPGPPNPTFKDFRNALFAPPPPPVPTPYLFFPKSGR